MNSRMDHFLTRYFRVLALSCSAQKRPVQQLVSSYLALMLGAMLMQLWRYFSNGWEMNDMHRHHRLQFDDYIKIIDAVSVAYLLVHILMMTEALLLRNRERRLLAQLPPLSTSPSALINMRLHVFLECLIIGCIIFMTLYQWTQGLHLLPNLREFYTMQAVRARYLQMALLVVRLDILLLALKQQLLNGRSSSLQLRASYEHIVRLARQLSRLYGLSVLAMNVLCIGDFVVVCYAYVILWRLTTMDLSWVLLWQTISVVLPTIIKIWTLCTVCDNCAKRSQELLVLINEDRRQKTAKTDSGTRSKEGLTYTEAEEFALQIMQNPVQFEVCGIYHLNLKSLAGMFVFILDSLVIFMQFLELTRNQTG